MGAPVSRHHRVVTHEEWVEEGRRRFGDDPLSWRFVCPSCGRVASVAEWKAAGAPEGEVAFCCVGRHVEGAKEAFAKGDNSRGCTYSGGGPFRLNPVSVIKDGVLHEMFEFSMEE